MDYKDDKLPGSGKHQIYVSDATEGDLEELRQRFQAAPEDGVDDISIWASTLSKLETPACSVLTLVGCDIGEVRLNLFKEYNRVRIQSSVVGVLAGECKSVFISHDTVVWDYQAVNRIMVSPTCKYILHVFLSNVGDVRPSVKEDAKDHTGSARVQEADANYVKSVLSFYPTRQVFRAKLAARLAGRDARLPQGDRK